MPILSLPIWLAHEPNKQPGLWNLPLVWKEKRYALKASRELLKSLLALKQDHPNLEAHELYEMVVAEHKNINILEARHVVDRAEESFAEWPVERAVRFQDVVRYLIVSEYMHTNDVLDGLGPHFGEIVERTIPKAL